MLLDHYHKAIIHFLGHRGAANTNEIAENIKISWATVNDKLKQLEKLGYVYKTRHPDRKKNTWVLAYE